MTQQDSLKLFTWLATNKANGIEIARKLDYNAYTDYVNASDLMAFLMQLVENDTEPPMPDPRNAGQSHS